MNPVILRLLIAIAGGILIGVGVIALFTLYPPDRYLYLPCLFHLTTGLHCPGCGSTRAVSSFISGDIALGFKNNLLIILWGPYLLYRFVLSLHSWIDGKQRIAWSPPKYSIIIFLFITIAYTILRNLPFEPFRTLFAPMN